MTTFYVFFYWCILFVSFCELCCFFFLLFYHFLLLFWFVLDSKEDEEKIKIFIKSDKASSKHFEEIDVWKCKRFSSKTTGVDSLLKNYDGQRLHEANIDGSKSDKIIMYDHDLRNGMYIVYKSKKPASLSSTSSKKTGSDATLESYMRYKKVQRREREAKKARKKARKAATKAKAAKQNGNKNENGNENETKEIIAKINNHGENSRLASM